MDEKWKFCYFITKKFGVNEALLMKTVMKQIEWNQEIKRLKYFKKNH